MKKILVFLLLLPAIAIILTGCATEYYPPRDNEKLGAIKRDGFIPWSEGLGKNMPLANPSFSVVGK